MTGQAQWAILNYLAAHGADEVPQPTHADLGLEGVTEAAKRCGNLRRSGANLWPTWPYTQTPAEDPWREVFGLVGSIGESLVVAGGCAIEAEWLRRAITAATLPEAMAIGQRFFAVAQAQEVLSIGHRLFNLVLRAVAARAELQERIGNQAELRRWADAHRPFSDDAQAWLSFSTRNTCLLRAAVVNSPHRSVRDLVDVLAGLVGSDAWADLAEGRGQDFHRWRIESAALAGIDERSGNIRQIDTVGDAGLAYAVTSEPIRYTAGDGREQEITRIAGDGLLIVTGALIEVLDALQTAAEPLSEGRLSWSGTAFGTTIGRAWADDRCACCNE